MQCADVLQSTPDTSAVDNPAHGTHSTAQRLQAHAMFQRREHSAAIANLETLVATRPADWRARADLLLCLRRSGRLDDAERHLDGSAAAAAAACGAASIAGFHYCKCGLVPVTVNADCVVLALCTP
jgi:Flp pilus assembly protein TadD